MWRRRPVGSDGVGPRGDQHGDRAVRAAHRPRRRHAHTTTAAPPSTNSCHGTCRRRTGSRRGSSGERVVALQRALASIGHDPGASDSDFGTRTENAVKAFQAQAGLKDDGVVGAKTIQAINERLGASRG
ncbi:MAG: peptidoglycan-binding domain-containing protein [Thermoleophilia bacterium]